MYFTDPRAKALTIARIGLLAGFSLSAPLSAQAPAFTSDDPVLEGIWVEGTENSHVYALAQELTDVVGPRLTGTPGFDAARRFLEDRYESWGIAVEHQQYGTWRGWRHGLAHLDLLEPRRTSLRAITLGWTPGTDGPVEGPVLVLPDVSSEADFRRWMEGEVPGAFVMTSFPQPTCRPESVWEANATPASLDAMRRDRETRQENWRSRSAASGVTPGALPRLLEEAGAAGILTTEWTGGWGTSRVFDAWTTTAPSVDLDCEDYGLLARLAENGQAPRIRLNVEAEFLGEVPTFNTVAMIRGTERPDEYVVLSAHLDTWGGATGATDNATGTVTMLEAMRILATVVPNPRRTILAGHWGGEEQGLNGSAAFTQDNPEVIEGLQILLNQDNGTGRVVDIGMQGLVGANAHFESWLARVPTEISRHITLDVPGLPDDARSDHASFVCHGVPAFRLGSHEWDYRDYTWHTNRDTFDKIVIEEVRGNAVLTAMLAYLASEEPELISRERRVMPTNPNSGEQMTWPACRTPRRTAS